MVEIEAMTDLLMVLERLTTMLSVFNSLACSRLHRQLMVLRRFLA